MRHGRKFNHLKRKSAHRKAMLANMANSLILNKRITTTVAKAKALRKYVEPLITKSKENTTHSRRMVFSYLGQKEPVTELFEVVAAKVGTRPGGYTRIIKTGKRLGDNAEMCMIELVDFNETYVKEEKKKSTRRRTRRGGSKKVTDSADMQSSKPKADAETDATTPVKQETKDIVDEKPEDAKVEEEVKEKKEEKEEKEGKKEEDVAKKEEVEKKEEKAEKKEEDKETEVKAEKKDEKKEDEKDKEEGGKEK